MQRTLVKIFFLLSPIFLSACSDQQIPGRQMTVTGNTVTIVNGIPIKQAELDILIKTRAAAKEPISQEKAIDELIGIELLRQQAVAQNIHNDENIAAEMNIKNTQVLATAAIKSHIKNLTINDQDLMMEYNKYVENLPSKQYHLRHILSKTKSEAETTITDLKNGQKFTELAKKRSIDGTGEQGGNLGWVTPSNFPEPFYDALKKTKAGQFYEEPLQSNKGWHVLMVEKSRELKPASFDEVSNNLKINITNQRIKSYLGELRSEADIQMPSNTDADSSSKKD